MTPEILVGKAVADALTKKGASVFPAVDHVGSTAALLCSPAYLLHRLHHEAPPLTLRMFCSLHAESENGNAPSWRTLHRTHWFLLAKGIIAMCATTLPPRVVRWIGICSGPPSSHPSVPVRVGHQMLHESHRLRFHKKSRAIGLVNECPGYLTRAGRHVLACIERGLSPNASADWPLMRDTVSINND